VEESPSPAVDEALRAELGAAAVAAGKAIGYTGAGTVEFVLEKGEHADRGAFFFLEVNTRLQVEHPVTELVTGLDLVALQLRIAEGHPLPAEVTGAQIDGHAIEVRLYAEDVPAGYLPATGTLHRFAIPALRGVRVDAGVTDGSVVSPHYDPMLAKVIAHGATRAEAARTLARALAQAGIHGVTTNRDLLVGILRDEEFLAGRTDTGYLPRHPELVTPGPDDGERVRAVAGALALQAQHRASARVLGGLPSGWRNVGGPPQSVAYTVGDRTLEVGYAFRRSSLDVTVDSESLDVDLLAESPEQVTLLVDGVRRSFRVHRAEDQTFVDGPDGSSAFRDVPRFADPNAVAHAGSLLAPMPGTVLRVLAGTGDAVTAGAALVVLEAMKMEHTVAAPVDGVVGELHVAPGDQVETRQVLAVVEDAAEAAS
jgi:propionyl-CoA carboxylase alpha chain